MNEAVVTYFRQLKESGTSFIYLPDVTAPEISVKKTEKTGISPLEQLIRKELPESTEVKRQRLNGLYKKFSDCSLCTLKSGRKKLVFGNGNPDSSLMFIGDFPESGDTETGKPYCAEEGKILNRIIENVMHMNRNDVIVMPLVKCPVIGMNITEMQQIESCYKIVMEQIDIVRPKYICCLGRYSAAFLLGFPFGTQVGVMRKKIFKKGSFTIVATYSLNSMLNTPSCRHEVKEDMEMLMKEMEIASE